MKSLQSMSKKLLLIVSLSFIFVSTSALAATSLSNKRNSTLIKQKVVSGFNSEITRNYTSLPTLTQNDYFPIVSAKAVLAVDVDSSVTLYEKNPDQALLPASTTKIVTALVAMDYYPSISILQINEIRIEGQKMGLIEGEEITAGDLLKGLLISSANDAAEALAQSYPGGRDAFIDAMNAKATELNLDNTDFANPSGLDAKGHNSTARDLIRVSTHAMAKPRFSEIVGTEETVVKSIDGSVVHKLSNINELVGSVDGVLGVKTGWTEVARENLVTYVERDGHKVMIAILGSQDRFGETKELIDWIFNSYIWQEVKITS